jgi:hypothetical protein
MLSDPAFVFRPDSMARQEENPDSEHKGLEEDEHKDMNGIIIST